MDNGIGLQRIAVAVYPSDRVRSDVYCIEIILVPILIAVAVGAEIYIICSVCRNSVVIIGAARVPCVTAAVNLYLCVCAQLNA